MGNNGPKTCSYREEVQQHQTRAAHHSQRAAELEGVLDGVKVKVQDLEDSYIHKASQQHSQFTQLQQEKKDAEVLLQYLLLLSVI